MPALNPQHLAEKEIFFYKQPNAQITPTREVVEYFQVVPENPLRHIIFNYFYKWGKVVVKGGAMETTKADWMVISRPQLYGKGALLCKNYSCNNWR